MARLIGVTIKGNRDVFCPGCISQMPLAKPFAGPLVGPSCLHLLVIHARRASRGLLHPIEQSGKLRLSRCSTLAGPGVYSMPDPTPKLSEFQSVVCTSAASTLSGGLLEMQIPRLHPSPEVETHGGAQYTVFSLRYC